MKKIFAIIAALLVSTSVFALETETYVDVKYDLDGSFYKSSKNSSNLDFLSQGFDITATFYAIGNLGLYGNFGYNFPYAGWIGGSSISDLDGIWTFDGTFGLAYKHDFSDSLQLAVNVGLHFAQMQLGSTDHTINSFGVGFDVGARYVPLKYLYVTAGAIGAYDFSLTQYLAGTPPSSLDGSSMINVRPYVGIGFIVYEDF